MRTDFVFDDGGMNLLSSAALRRIGEALPGGGTSLFVFRSGRPGLFAAGADMAEMQRFTAEDASEFSRLGQELFARIERLPCVTVAIIDGDCFGGALDLVLAFDLRIATPRSRFAHPGARLGIVTGFGGTSRWRSVISRRAANQLFLANRVLSATEAFEMQLVDVLTETPEVVLSRLETSELRLAKELSVRAGAASRDELVTLARAAGATGFSR